MSGRHDPLEVTPSLLLRAYAAGVFPMAETADADEIFWVDPKSRAIIPLDGFHLSKSLAKRARRGQFSVTTDHAFEAVLDACADRPETWINEEIRALYLTLHRMGYAHSIEVWHGHDLIGGLYGVALGGAFFGESMFSHATDGSKLGLVWTIARLRAGGFKLLDTQFMTPHLARLGAIEISRAEYHDQLGAALETNANWDTLSADTPTDQILQLVTQTS